MKKVLIIGDAMLDSYHFGDVNRISPEAPVPVFLEKNKKKYSAGGAANVAVNIATIGIPTDFIGLIGNDEYGRVLKNKLSESKVNTELMLCLDEYRTISKLRYIGLGNQQILRVDTEDISPVSFEVFKKVLSEVDKHINEYGLFLLSDYMKGLLTEETTQAIIELANKNKIPVFVDVKDKNIAKYRNATLLKPNKKELAALSNERVADVGDAIKAAKKLCKEAKAEYVLATLGADGMILVSKNGLLKEARSMAKEVYDVTGAGDTSIAYLAAEVIKGSDIDTAMTISNYAAGVQVSKVGTAIVYPEEVQAAMLSAGETIGGKVLDYYKEETLAPIERAKTANKKIVFTNGCFDILHKGHITYLREAKKLGDILVIGVNSDASVKRLKGEDRPINPLSDRMEILAALEFVDYVVHFEEDTPLDLIKKIMPDVLVKGGDYKIEDIVGAKEVMANNGEVKVLNFVAGKSTTSIVEKIRKE